MTEHEDANECDCACGCTAAECPDQVCEDDDCDFCHCVQDSCECDGDED